MKKIYHILPALLCIAFVCTLFSSCSETYDDSALLERIAALEEQNTEKDEALAELQSALETLQTENSDLAKEIDNLNAALSASPRIEKVTYTQADIGSDKFITKLSTQHLKTENNIIEITCNASFSHPIDVPYQLICFSATVKPTFPLLNIFSLP